MPAKKMLAPRETLWPAPPLVVQAALDFLNLKVGDKLADFGCGDGPALFAAAARGATAVGWEVVAPRADALRAEVARRGLQDAITVVTGNALDAELEPFRPTHVYLYLIARGLRLILPLLRRAAALLPGGVLPVVTLLYPFEGIEPVATQRVDTSPISRTPVYFYLIRASEAAAPPGEGGA